MDNPIRQAGLSVESRSRFAYGPQWPFLFKFWVAAIAALALTGVRVIPFVVGVGLGILPLAFALIGTFRRLLVPAFLELGEETVSLCTGFLQAQVVQLPYADIEESWEVVRGKMTILTLRTKERTFEIVSILLPDAGSYAAVREFINSRLTLREKSRVSQCQPPEPGKYCFTCSYEGDGEIYDSNGEILWRFKTQHFNSRPRYPYGLFRVPDFVVYARDGVEAFRIKFQKKWALAQFVMLENSSPVCAIRLKSPLRNKYTLAFVNGQNWVFKMPLFTVSFRGHSDSGKDIQVRMWSHNVWYVLVDPSADNPQLIAALAFLHRERLRFS
jgi:hypothetical protein